MYFSTGGDRSIESSEIGEYDETTSPCSDSGGGSEVEDELPRVLEGLPLPFQ